MLAREGDDQCYTLACMDVLMICWEFEGSLGIVIM